jgi:ATP-dependent helicase/nuclease subunit A
VERRKAVACRNRTAALLHHRRCRDLPYQSAKDRRGLLDYDDLIDKALTCWVKIARPGCITSSIRASTTC